MSYILDALKKSQVAQHGDEVTLNVAGARKSVPRWVFVVIATLVLGNAGLAAWIVFPAPVPPPIAAPGPVETAVERGVSVRAPEDASVQTSPAVEEPMAAIQTPPSDSAPLPAAEERPAQVFLETYALAGLSAEERTVFEAFDYTSHIYSDDPELCAIVINGNRYAVGDSIDGFEIDEITPDGVIFKQATRNGNRLVSVSVIDAWNSDD